ncbi:hypothetical protein AcW1_008290 [Taiwanofungus camphoratus]|uniref:Immunomodulatory protein n=1 Tax=Taiwanofungus camphoratus TaxID=2696576 RepID=D2CFK3_TAICA|nr:immunomodulatory protein [Taiwanofungus camphoratus]KAI0926002.1 hypothetical protein AcV5_008584 [Antrodia cinnamomea]KAI0951177.1 hypothetical protein AcW1_008290 [Antrodia cinnamomea]KAI0956064.1 hypothetical protein AcV7_006573 [Antrodia cinnamomea]
MKFTTSAILATIFSLPAVFSQTTYKVTYNQYYDDGSNSLSTVACSNGENGLLTKGYTTLDSLPDFPYIGGAFAVTGWNSTGCGTCWELSYNGTSINILAIDTSYTFDISLEALQKLSDGQGEAAGFVYATATQVDASVCGL